MGYSTICKEKQTRISLYIYFKLLIGLIVQVSNKFVHFPSRKCCGKAFVRSSYCATILHFQNPTRIV